MKRINWPLLIGGVILCMLLLLILFPNRFTHLSPYTIAQLRFFTVDGVLSAEKAPFMPSAEFIMGTDDLGRDIWSYIVYGTRLTLLLGVLIAAIQFLIALPVSLIGGMGSKAVKNMTHQLNVMLSAIPALLICILVLQIDFFTSLEKQQSIIAFIAILSFVGWPKLGVLLLERVEAVYRLPFVRGEIALGKSTLKIALENIVPHLIPECLVLFFMEVARGLTLMMQLGVFGVFIGNLKVIMDSDRGAMTYYNISYEPEWASMLSTSRTYLTTAPWSVLYPALAFFITVLGFNLFGEGLRRQLQKPGSQLISNTRKLLLFDFGMIRQGIMNQEKISFSKFLIVFSALALLVLSIFNQPRYTFRSKEWDLPNVSEAMIGTDEEMTITEYIADSMKSLGIVPLAGDTYAIGYETSVPTLIRSQQINILGDTVYSAKVNEDFNMIRTGTFERSGPVFDATDSELMDIRDYTAFDDSFVLLDATLYTDEFIQYFIETVDKESSALGFLLITDAKERKFSVLSGNSDQLSVIQVSDVFAEKLKQKEPVNIEVKAVVDTFASNGTNLVGIYKGSDRALEDEIIAVGLNYNYLETQGKDVLEFNLELMKQLCSLKGNKRSVVFMFIDGTMEDSLNGIHDLAKNFPISPQKVKLYIDLTQVTSNTFAYLEYSHKQAQVTRQFAWSIGKMLKEEFDGRNITTVDMKTIKQGNEYRYVNDDAMNAMYWDAGVATIIVKTPDALSGQTGLTKAETGNENVEHIALSTMYSLEDLGEALVKTIGKNNY